MVCSRPRRCKRPLSAAVQRVAAAHKHWRQLKIAAQLGCHTLRLASRQVDDEQVKTALMARGRGASSNEFR